MKRRKYLTVTVKLPEERKPEFEFITRGSIRRVIFPQELINKTIENNEPAFKNKMDIAKGRRTSNRKISSCYVNTVKRQSVLESIRIAAQNYKCFPLNQIQYVQLLWNLFDEITELLKHTVPIIRSSPNSNLIRCLYMIFVQTKEAVIRLVEYEVKPISKKLFEQVCWKLMDNVVTCNRILLACCYVQNSYQTVNEPLQKLIIISVYLEAVVAFLSTAILQSGKRVRNYIPSGYIIRHLRCCRCLKIVSLSGCKCTNWELDTLTQQHIKLYMNAIEDGPTTSKANYIKSWKTALKKLMALPSASKSQVSKEKPVYSVRQITIQEPNKKKHKTNLKRKAGDTIDEVWLANQVSSFLNEWSKTHQYVEITKEKLPLAVDLPAIKRKAVDYTDIPDEEVAKMLSDFCDVADLEELLAEFGYDEY